MTGYCKYVSQQAAWEISEQTRNSDGNILLRIESRFRSADPYICDRVRHVKETRAHKYKS